MVGRISGIHHITAIAGDPQRNLDFYTRVLGLRMIKLTINYDDPGTYHFYFGDNIGSPGTILTFFPFAYATRGESGSGLASTISFRVNRNALPFWVDRLAAKAVDFDAPDLEFGREVLSLRDPDGLELALVGEESSESKAFHMADIPPENEIAGFDSVSLAVARGDETIRLFTDMFGAIEFATEGNVTRLHLGTAPGGIGSIVDVVDTGGRPPGRMGAGSVHHVAFRCASNEEQVMWRERLIAEGFGVTEVRDRNYFRSIYFREPCGILFEIATESPGFAIDEAPERLGTSLKLPPWLEEKRQAIEAGLQKLKLPLQ